jgi:hypothetical protein
MSNIDTIFKKLEKAEMTPPQSVWEGIASALKEENDRKIIFWYSTDAAKIATLFLGFAGAIGMFLFLKSSMMPIFNQLMSNKPEIVFTNPDKIEEIQNQEKAILSQKAIQENSSNSQKFTKNKIQNTVSNSQNSIEGNQSTIEIADNQSTNDNPSNVRSTTEQNGETEIESKSEQILTEQLKDDSEWELIEPIESINNGVLISDNSMEIASQNYTYETPVLDRIKQSFNPYFYLTTTLGINAAQVFMNSDAQNSYFTGNATFNKKFGYQFGSEIGYQFTKKWSIESGLMYSQYIQTFSEKDNLLEKNGFMYIDQIEFPLMARYSIFLKEENPLILSFKAGLMYGSVLQYQVNYVERELLTLNERKFSIDADKRNYNSLQLGYIAGFDLDAFVSKKVALHISSVTSYLSQLENFPFFSAQKEKPKQLATSFAVGMKFKF